MKRSTQHGVWATALLVAVTALITWRERARGLAEQAKPAEAPPRGTYR